MPESLARGFRRVHTGTQYLDWTRRGLADARRRPADRGKRIQKLIHARRDTGADVEDPRVGPREGPEDGLDHVRDVHVVALVAAVPEDRDWLAPFPAADEDRDDTALEVLSLARPVEVREAERHGPQVRRLDQLFGLRLESAVVRLRVHRYVLFGAARRFPVDRPSGRDIHDDRGAEATRGLEHVAGPADDDALVELFLGHRLDDLRLRRAVHDGRSFIQISRVPWNCGRNRGGEGGQATWRSQPARPKVGRARGASAAQPARRGLPIYIRTPVLNWRIS